jgi:hypothetical protein
LTQRLREVKKLLLNLSASPCIERLRLPLLPLVGTVPHRVGERLAALGRMCLVIVIKSLVKRNLRDLSVALRNLPRRAANLAAA